MSTSGNRSRQLAITTGVCLAAVAVTSLAGFSGRPGHADTGAVAGPCGPADSLSAAFKQAAGTVAPSVVHITVVDRDRVAMVPPVLPRGLPHGEGFGEDFFRRFFEHMPPRLEPQAGPAKRFVILKAPAN